MQMPASRPSPELNQKQLKTLQFHLMEASLGLTNLDILAENLEENVKALKSANTDETFALHSLYNEFKTHLQSRHRFINALKLQLEIAKLRNHPHIAELKGLLDQAERHLDSPFSTYFIACFQTALVNPNNKDKHLMENILEKIKTHSNLHKEYVGELVRELTRYYVY